MIQRVVVPAPRFLPVGKSTHEVQRFASGFAVDVHLIFPFKKVDLDMFVGMFTVEVRVHVLVRRKDMILVAKCSVKNKK